MHNFECPRSIGFLNSALNRKSCVVFPMPAFIHIDQALNRSSVKSFLSSLDYRGLSPQYALISPNVLAVSSWALHLIHVGQSCQMFVYVQYLGFYNFRASALLTCCAISAKLSPTRSTNVPTGVCGRWAPKCSCMRAAYVLCCAFVVFLSHDHCRALCQLISEPVFLKPCIGYVFCNNCSMHSSMQQHCDSQRDKMTLYNIHRNGIFCCNF